MPYRSFLLQLAGLTGILVLLTLLLGVVAPLADFQGIVGVSILFFVLFSIVVYWLAGKAARSTNKYSFTHVTFLFIFGKLLFSVIIVLAYKKIAAPDTNWFVIPFFFIYLCYSIFETSFMMKLGRINNQS